MAKLIKPIYTTKRFWLNLTLGSLAMLDYSTGAIRELLPGREGAVLLILIGFLNVFFQVRVNRRVRRAVDEGRISVNEDISGRPL